jgi:hypothetical protein
MRKPERSVLDAIQHGIGGDLIEWHTTAACGAGQDARALQQIEPALANGCDEPGQRFRAVLAVGVYAGDELGTASDGCREPILHRGAVTAVGSAIDELQRRTGEAGCQNDVARSVAAAVVDHDDARDGQIGEPIDPPEHALDVAGGIVRGNHHHDAHAKLACGRAAPLAMRGP